MLIFRKCQLKIPEYPVRWITQNPNTKAVRADPPCFPVWEEHREVEVKELKPSPLTPVEILPLAFPTSSHFGFLSNSFAIGPSPPSPVQRTRLVLNALCSLLYLRGASDRSASHSQDCLKRLRRASSTVSLYYFDPGFSR
jgi:hypothetical protein